MKAPQVSGLFLQEAVDPFRLKCADSCFQSLTPLRLYQYFYLFQWEQKWNSSQFLQLPDETVHKLTADFLRNISAAILAETLNPVVKGAWINVIV